MTSTATTRAVVHSAQRVLRRLRVGGVLLVFPGLMPRFGEPSAILFAEITCPQPIRTVVTLPKAPAKLVSVNCRGVRPAAAPIADRQTTRSKPRSFFSFNLREWWEGRREEAPVRMPDQAPAPIATRAGEQSRS